MKKNEIRRIVSYCENNFSSGPDKENGSCMSTRFLYLYRRIGISNARIPINHYLSSDENKLRIIHALDEYEKEIVPEWRKRRLMRDVLLLVVRIIALLIILYFCVWLKSRLVFIVVSLYFLAYLAEMAISLPLCLVDEYIKGKITYFVFK